MSPDMRLRSGAEGVKTKAEAAKLWKDGEDERLLHFLPWLNLPQNVFEDEEDAVKAGCASRIASRGSSSSTARKSACRTSTSSAGSTTATTASRCTKPCAAWAEPRLRATASGSSLVRGAIPAPAASKVGGVDFGKAAALDTKQVEIRWFDHWLKGKDNGVNKDAPVRIFVMGANQWRDEQEWPPARAKPHTLHLHSAGAREHPGR